MLTKEQLEERKNYIGASECAGVLGCSRWQTPLSVWASKTGQIELSEEESLAQWWGSELEDTVARRFMKETCKKVQRVNETIFHKDYPFIATNLDRRVVGENAILECKTASAWKSKEWQREEIPQEYILQCYHELAVSGKQKCYLAVAIGNQEFHIKEIYRDEKIIADILRREMLFWNGYVVPRIMPKLITKHDGDTLDLLFPRAVPEKEIILSSDVNQTAEFLLAYKQDSKSLGELIDKFQNELKSLVKDGEVGLTSLYKIRWSNSTHSQFDASALEKEMPEIYQKFYRTKPTRRFSCKKINQGD